jgi:hypothetical protein
LGINELRADLLDRTKVNQHNPAIFSAADQVGGFDITMNNILLMDKR